ncbi:MAG: hypothetical protein JW910_04105 [Anaerolineae bacterium]|nr:hypothetical protein [Anaerolineae bacterium]
MAEEQNRIPPTPEDDAPAPPQDAQPAGTVDVPVEVSSPVAPPAAPAASEAAPAGDDGEDFTFDDEDEADRMAERLERLGGEPAPAISPEEFARLQQSGQIHIDSRGRIRSSRREDADAGMSLRKRRAWYGQQ